MNNITLKEYEGMKYYEYLPANFDEGKKYPFMVFLHGAGERGAVELAKKHGPIREVENGLDLPCVLIVPSCEENKTWFNYLERLAGLIKQYRKNAFIDKDRICMTGLSMGGYGTWAFGMAFPELLSAIAPLCGGGMAWNAKMLVKTPVWAFHGDQDNVVHISESEKMVQALKSCGGNVKYTVYNGYYHDIWTVTYKNPEFYSWILSQVRCEEYITKDE